MEILCANIQGGLAGRSMDRLVSYLSHDKRSRLGRFRHRDDGLRMIAGDVLVRRFFCTALDVSNEELDFNKTPHGKPVLVQAQNPSSESSWEFNISHSGDWVVAVFDTSPVGIDIQEVAPVALDVANRFFSHNELRALVEIPETQKLDFFYTLWTLKESYVKALGKGLYISLDAFSIIIEPTGEIWVETGTLEPRVYFRQYQIASGYKTAVCSYSPEFCPDIELVDLADVVLS